MPSLRSEASHAFFETVDPAFLLLSLRYFYLAALRFEALYQLQFEPKADKTITEAFRSVQAALGEKLQQMGDGVKQFAMLGQLPQVLEQSGSEGPEVALGVLRTLTHFAQLMTDERGLQLWHGEIQNDWGWCHPLTSQEPGDLKQFLARALWEEQGFYESSGYKTAQTWADFVRGIAVRSNIPGAVALVEIHIAHTVRPIDWEEMRGAVLAPRMELDAPTQAAIRRLVDSPEELAILLSRLVIRDRTHCELLSRPSLAGFQAVLRSTGADDPGRIIALEADLAHPTFQPHPLWLSWVQVVHRPALAAIGQSLRNWLPAEPTPAPETVTSPGVNAPAKAARQPRAKAGRKKK